MNMHKAELATTLGPLIFLAVTGIALITLSRFPRQPKQAVSAEVIRIAAQPSRNLQTTTVTIRTTDGLVGESIVPSSILYCRIGQKVDATKEGSSVYLKPGQCTRSKLW